MAPAPGRHSQVVLQGQPRDESVRWHWIGACRLHTAQATNHSPRHCGQTTQSGRPSWCWWTHAWSERRNCLSAAGRENVYGRNNARWHSWHLEAWRLADTSGHCLVVLSSCRRRRSLRLICHLISLRACLLYLNGLPVWKSKTVVPPTSTIITCQCLLHGSLEPLHTKEGIWTKWAP